MNKMSFLDSIFGKKSKENSNLDWNTLSDIAQLETIVKNSSTKTQAIFKHSTRCGISSVVLRKFEKQFDISTSIDLYFLDLLSNRELSNEIAHRFNILHQSPQLLIIKNKKIVYHASHYDIISNGILDFV